MAEVLSPGTDGRYKPPRTASRIRRVCRPALRMPSSKADGRYSSFRTEAEEDCGDGMTQTLTTMLRPIMARTILTKKRQTVLLSGD